jgi:CrcB protein
MFPGMTFPLGTLAVNLVGCLCIGLLTGLADARQVLAAEARAFLLIGVLGAFTTFSTFGHETFVLMREGEPMRVLANVAGHVILGLGCVWAGYAVGTIR